MKLRFLMLMLSLLAVLLAAPFVLFKNAPNSVFSGVKQEPTSELSTFYKWQDREGNWQYSDKAPIGVKATPIKIDPNANLVSAFQQNDDTRDELLEEESGSKFPLLDAPLSFPNQAKELIEKAQNVEQLLKHRQAERDELLENE